MARPSAITLPVWWPRYCIYLAERSCCPLECPRDFLLAQSRKTLGSGRGQGRRARMEGGVTTGLRGLCVFNSCTGLTRALCLSGQHSAQRPQFTSLQNGPRHHISLLPGRQRGRGGSSKVLWAWEVEMPSFRTLGQDCGDPPPRWKG